MKRNNENHLPLAYGCDYSYSHALHACYTWYSVIVIATLCAGSVDFWWSLNRVHANKNIYINTFAK